MFFKINSNRSVVDELSLGEINSKQTLLLISFSIAWKDSCPALSIFLSPFPRFWSTVTIDSLKWSESKVIQTSEPWVEIWTRNSRRDENLSQDGRICVLCSYKPGANSAKLFFASDRESVVTNTGRNKLKTNLLADPKMIKNHYARLLMGRKCTP